MVQGHDRRYTTRHTSCSYAVVLFLLSLFTRQLPPAFKQDHTLIPERRTSMFMRLPTVVARPSPPPPDELYKKVGYAPIASSLQWPPVLLLYLKVKQEAQECTTELVVGCSIRTRD